MKKPSKHYTCYGMCYCDYTQLIMIKESHFYVDDKKEHDTFFVQHCLLLHWEWFVGQGVKPQEHWVFFDSCAS
jgi:hypothetical protein